MLNYSDLTAIGGDAGVLDWTSYTTKIAVRSERLSDHKMGPIPKRSTERMDENDRTTHRRSYHRCNSVAILALVLPGCVIAAKQVGRDGCTAVYSIIAGKSKGRRTMALEIIRIAVLVYLVLALSSRGMVRRCYKHLSSTLVWFFWSSRLSCSQHG